MINYVLLASKLGKVRVVKWYNSISEEDIQIQSKKIVDIVSSRSADVCNIVEHDGQTIVYKRYASLLVIFGSTEENELEILEIIHRYVEVLDKYFGNVCELDLIFNFDKAYYALNELLINGALIESSKNAVLRSLIIQDDVEEAEKHK